MLAKVAANTKKPDGLTVIADSDLPNALHGLKLHDFPGIGPRMVRRFNLYGVFAVSQLCAMPEKAMAEVWGSKVLGGRWYRLLRGEDVPDQETRRQTVSHSHILPPDLRSDAGSYGVLVRLTHKAAARLRKIGYWTGAVAVNVGFLDEERADEIGVESVGMEFVVPPSAQSRHAEYSPAQWNRCGSSGQPGCRSRWEWCCRICGRHERDTIAIRGRPQGGGPVARDG